MYFPCVLWFLSLFVGTAHLLRTVSDDSEVQLPVTRTDEGWYSAEIQIAGVSTHLLVDTGSSALWARIPKSAKATLQSKNSSVGHFSAQYGRGAVSGEVADVPVLLASSSHGKSRKCHVGRPADEGGFWSNQHSIDGVLGLGCSEEGAPADALACVVPTPPQRPLLFGPRQKRVFSLELTPTGGTLTLGSIPRAVQLNMVSMPPSDNCGHWTVPLVSLKVTGSDAKQVTSDAQAILDSGSDGVIGPTFAVIDLARRLGAQPAKAGEGYGGEVTFYEVPCDSIDSLPSIELVLGKASGAKVAVTLRGADLVSQGKDGQENCHLRVAGWETQSWILGAVFLTRLQAVAFDIENGVASIAPKAN